MSYYQEQSLTGQEWQRAARIEIGNPYNEIPWISFQEERITLLDNGRRINTPVGNLCGHMSDPSIEFDLVHPVDGSPLGTATYGQLQVLLYSLYLHLAANRDTP